MQGKRKHPRIPLDIPFLKQVEIYTCEPSGTIKERVGGSIHNMSAGGFMVQVESPIRKGDCLSIVLRCAGPLEGLRVTARVMWLTGAGIRKSCGLRFLNPSADTVGLLVKVTEDYVACERRMSFGLKDICRRACCYWAMCAKPVKLNIDKEPPVPPAGAPPPEDPFDWSGSAVVD